MDYYTTLLFVFGCRTGYGRRRIWLIYKEKIFIDRETKQITEIEIPGGWKFRTNIPVGRIGVMEELKNWEELGSDLDGRIGVRP